MCGFTLKRVRDMIRTYSLVFLLFKFVLKQKLLCFFVDVSERAALLSIRNIGVTEDITT